MGGSCCQVENKAIIQIKQEINSQESMQRKEIIRSPQNNPQKQNLLEPILLVSIMNLKETQDYSPNDLTDEDNCFEQQTKEQNNIIEKQVLDNISTTNLAFFELDIIDLPSLKKLRLDVVKQPGGSKRSIDLNHSRSSSKRDIDIISCSKIGSRREFNLDQIHSYRHVQLDISDSSREIRNRFYRVSSKDKFSLREESGSIGKRQRDNCSMRSNITSKSNLKKGRFQMQVSGSVNPKSFQTASFKNKRVRFEMDSNSSLRKLQSMKKR